MKALVFANSDLEYPWVGARRTSGDEFEWIVSLAALPSNSPLWNTDNPGNLGDCVYSERGSSGALEEYDCYGVDHYICEKY